MTPPRTIYLLKRIETLSRVRLDEKLRVLGLSAGQYATLSLLGQSGETSSAELARRVMISPQSMFEIISALAEKGLISRVLNQRNRRILDIRMTPLGKDVLAQAEHLVDAIERSMFSAIDPASYALLRDSLMAILKSQTPPR